LPEDEYGVDKMELGRQVREAKPAEGLNRDASTMISAATLHGG